MGCDGIGGMVTIFLFTSARHCGEPPCFYGIFADIFLRDLRRSKTCSGVCVSFINQSASSTRGGPEIHELAQMVGEFCGGRVGVEVLMNS